MSLKIRFDGLHVFIDLQLVHNANTLKIILPCNKQKNTIFASIACPIFSGFLLTLSSSKTGHSTTNL